MPRFQTTNDDGDVVERYMWPAQYVTTVDGIDEALRDWRRNAINERESFLQSQRTCGRDNLDLAKLFKDCANRMLRLQRACTLMLPWMGSPDTNQLPVRPLLWPVDLERELDEIANRIVIQFG